MNKEQEQNMLKFIDALEGVNELLGLALKGCLRLLSVYPPVGENPVNWKKMLNDLEDIAGLSAKTFQQRKKLLY